MSAPIVVEVTNPELVFDIDAPTLVLEVVSTGPQGPAGSSSSFVFTQVTPAATWTINHGLNATPVSCTVVNVAGFQIVAEVEHKPSGLQTIVRFASPVAGSARLIA